MSRRKRILVAPLDWGLGHATRCIPLIREIISGGHDVVLASDGRALELLKSEFPELTAIRLQGYHPVYPKDGDMVMKMALQVPKFFAAIVREHFQLKKIIRQHAIDFVVSDNRYGLWSTEKPSVIITHQLFIRMPDKMQWMQSAVNRLNHFFLQRFQRCWVPDVAQEENLSGALSHGATVPGHVEFIGMLSRFSSMPYAKKYDLLVLLSGPEPQRTILENEIMRQVKVLQVRTLFVRGVTEENKKVQLTETIEVVSYLTSQALNEALSQSDVVICRSGYSSIMELASLQKAAILISTPGQTEQEYLAERLAQIGFSIAQHQDVLDIKQGLSVLKKLKNTRVPFEGDAFKKVLKEWLESQD